MTPHSLFAPARRVGQGLLRTQADDRLVDLARSGSEPAFEAIVARYRKPLLRYCVRLVSDQRAEEAVQETFVRAYAALMRGEVVRTLKPWLYRIAHNSALNTVRVRPLSLVALDDGIEATETTEVTAERQEGLRDVVSAVQALPIRQRDAIVQRELEGRSYDEIAAALGVSNGAVRQLLNRARTSLRAGAAAVAAPFTPLARLLAGLGDAPAGRVAEMCGAGPAGGVAAKLCATVALSGVLAGGVAPATDPAGGSRERAKAERPEAKASVATAPPATQPAVQLSAVPAPGAAATTPVPTAAEKPARPRSKRRERSPREHGDERSFAEERPEREPRADQPGEAPRPQAEQAAGPPQHGTPPSYEDRTPLLSGSDSGR
jgi:RNA polymerase sigma factor (sigma-70 family)